MTKDNFCCVDDIQVIIPYKEYEKMVQSSNKIKEMEEAYTRMEEKYVAIQQMFREALEKIREINTYL